jgi:uncharacterized CHY-type Zn-finger protein
VCFECGKAWGTHPLKSSENHRSWIDLCDVCLKLTAVADASEYGYMKEGWDGEKVV